MSFGYLYSQDIEFLKAMDVLPQKELFVKIVILDFFTERDIGEIQGRATGGSINLDGKSAVRRTANISLVADEDNYSITNINNLIAINKKIRIEIGITNCLQFRFPQYANEDIIWYPQGIYVINNATVARNAQGLTLSIQAKDKMCLLNGDCGGVLTTATEFDGYDSTDSSGNTRNRVKYPIFEIIGRIVHDLGGESWDRILINDIDNRIQRTVKWAADNDVKLYFIGDEQSGTYTLTEPAGVTDENTFEYGEDVGYVYSDFFYPSLLEEQAGTALTAVLDKIKNTLGNYEYFYDVYGNFVFQEIKNYLNTSATNSSLNLSNLNYIADIVDKKSYYDFTNSTIVTAYTNNPQFNLIKNDFVIWGNRKGVDGKNIPIRYHLALDTKPELHTYEYLQGYYIDQTEHQCVIKKAKIKSPSVVPIVGELYYQDVNTYYWYKKASEEARYPTYVQLSTEEMNNIVTKIIPNDFRAELYLSGLEAQEKGLTPNIYYQELTAEWPKLYTVDIDVDTKTATTELAVDLTDELDYFLDFIDTGEAYQQFGIPAIGRRTKVINDKEVDCIFRHSPKDYILIELGTDTTATERDEALKNHQSFAQVPTNIFNACVFSESRYSAYEALQLILHEYTGYNRQVQIVTLPIYHLEPNTRVTIEDRDSNITGDFMVNSFNLPLDISGTSTLNCTQAQTRI